uniref:MHC class I-like antigen recognition-like domain-containing protein n=1 Tax=Accipiter nisus TaxID=211598 RepID=A0A8B9MZN0_9AVES
MQPPRPWNPKDPSLTQPLHFPQPSPLTCISPCQLLSCVGSFTLRLLQTSTFQNNSFVDTEGLGLLEDIELGSLDKHTWTIHFYQPWVRPALPRGDWDTIENMIKIYLQKFNHLINKGAMQKDVPYPFVAQCMAGCEVYPNRTSRAFAYVGYNGQDFLSFNMDNATWLLSQDTKLSRYVQAVLQNYTAFTELVEVLFNDTCVDDIEVLLHYGKAALERQGETTLTLAWPPQSPTHTGAKQELRGGGADCRARGRVAGSCCPGCHLRTLGMETQVRPLLPSGAAVGEEWRKCPRGLLHLAVKLLLPPCQLLSAAPQGLLYGVPMSHPPLISESTNRWRNQSPGTPS